MSRVRSKQEADRRGCGNDKMVNSDRHLNMPEDLLMEILLRLSVKSLLRFKCVCKNWYDLIQNPNFEQTHLLFQQIRNKGRLFLQYYNEDFKKVSFALFPDETLTSDAHYDIDCLHSDGYASTNITGPVNGLFCLFNGRDRFLIWNPAIREFRTLPYPKRPYSLHCSDYRLGFGLDSSTNDYKVVLIRESEDPMYEYVDVYSLRSNDWRHLDDLECKNPPYSRTGTYSDGVYYWLSGDDVLAFDLGKEFFRKIRTPSELSGWGYWDVPPHSLEPVAIYNVKQVPGSEVDSWCEIWVMGVEEGSWIKQFTTRPIPGFVSPQGFWESSGGLLLLTNDSIPMFADNTSVQLVLYDTSTQGIRDLGPKRTYHGCRALVYDESLISVGGGVSKRKGKLSDSVADHLFFLPQTHGRFTTDLVYFMWEFQMMKKKNIEPTEFTYPDHIKVGRLLSRLWDSCTYSVRLPVI